MNIKPSLLIVTTFLLAFDFFSVNGSGQGNAGSWKAGFGKIMITPDQPTWMAGYASRTRPSEGTLNDLWAKAMVLEDKSGGRALLITTDLIGFPKKMSESIKTRLHDKYGLAKEGVILSSSHTHSGPVLTGSLVDIYPMGPAEWEKTDKYSSKLEDEIVEIAGKAINSMVPVRLYSGNGVVRFQVNRRNNIEKDLTEQSELKGPNDYAVPVIKIAGLNDEILAVIFGYACHATVLSSYKWSGDYPGYAQSEIERVHPGAMAMFFAGAGSDQNPIPRRTVGLAKQYGTELASAVERVLTEEMKPLSPTLSVAYTETDLPLNDPMSPIELEKMANDSASYQQRWASHILEKIRNGQPVLHSYPYPVQIWNIGEQMIAVMGGEPVVEYAINLKRMFGRDIFVMGYSNDVMAYIPSERILREGGYEGEISQRAFGLPSTWNPVIEKTILQEFENLAGKMPSFAAGGKTGKKENAVAAGLPGVNNENAVGHLAGKHYFSGFEEAHDTYNAISAASDGKIYYVLSSQDYNKGGQMFVYNPSTDKTKFLADLTDVCGEREMKAIAQGKSHVRFYEYKGKIYFATHVGYYEIIDGMERLPVTPPPDYKLYQRGHILSYDLASGKFEDLGIASRGEGVLTLTMDRVRGKLYAITWPTGYFIRFDLDTQKFSNLGKVALNGEAGIPGTDYRVLCRSMFVDPRDGAVYYSVPEGDIYVCRLNANAPEKVEGVDLRLDYFGKYDPSNPGSMGYNWRAISWYEPEGVAYGVHGNSGYLFRFDPRERKVEIVDRITSEPSRKSGMFDQFSYGYLGFQLGPDGKNLYYLTGGPVYVNGKRVKGLDEIAMGAAKGLENLHLVTYNIPEGKYTDNGPVFYEDGGRPTYVNSIAVGANGDVYTLARFEQNGKTIEDLVRIPGPFPKK